MTVEEIYNKIRIVPNDASFGFDGIKNICFLAEKLPKGISVLEIGTAYGRSAIIWALATEGKITTIDIQDVQYLVEAFSKKMNLDITAINGDSTKIDIKDKYDVVWIDGNHDYEYVISDIKKLDPLAKKLICGHDYNHILFPGVGKAVNEFYGNNFATIGTIWYVFKNG